MKFFLSLCFLLTSGLAVADCSRPAAPELPDGETSDLQAMVDGQKAVKEYVAATEAYLVCLKAEGESTEVEETPEQQTARIDAHNAAVDEMNAVADKFNEEIREYKEKSQ